MNRIIYKTDEGELAVIIPSDNALAEHTIQEIAEKDVPAGKPYKIVSVDDIPSDRTFRNAWEVDEANLTDGTGGEHDMFITDPQHPDYVAPEEEVTAE
tara:strand:- start:35 stop:328 length:294 start_codon:yes stop_codon:yes gene_type:complete